MEDVVLDQASFLPSKGHIITTDSLFGSLELLNSLSEREMFGNVTCTSKRPTSIFQNFLHSEEFALDKIGDWVSAQGTKFHDHPLLFSAFSYKGKRIMNILSTAYNCLDSQT